jgi:hypothetical protein
MALADPQSLPTTPAATSLARIGAALGLFGSADLTYQLSVEHSTNSRSRHVVKLTQRKISADPLLPTQNREYTQSVHLVIDQPKSGFTAAETSALTEVFVNYMDDATLIGKLVQGQS